MSGSVIAGSLFGVRYKRVEKERKLNAVDNDSAVFKKETIEDAYEDSDGSDSL
jgi:hypothetical protein